MNIYVLHYTPLKSRRENMEKQLLNIDFKICWVTQFDREVITPEDIEKNYVYNPNMLPRGLYLSEIANGIAHNYIIEETAKSDIISLILEDDIIFKPNFFENLNKAIQNAPSDWELLTLGGHYDDGTGYYENDTKEINNFEIVIPKRICTTVSCYVLKPSLAQKIIQHSLFRPFCTPIDETLCTILPDISAKVYWCKPWLAYEGSKHTSETTFTTSMGRGF